MKTRPMLESEIYRLIQGQNVKRMFEIIKKEFPRSRGELRGLNLQELEKIIPLLKKEYQQ